MCIFAAGYKNLKGKAVTLLELLIVLIIVGILAGIGFVGWQGMVEREHTENAKAALKMLWQAEENYSAWKGRYTANWNNLEIEGLRIVDSNRTDNFYVYTIEKPTPEEEAQEVTSTALLIRATRGNKGFTIDQDCNIESFTTSS